MPTEHRFMQQNSPTFPKPTAIALGVLVVILIAGLWFGRNLSSPVTQTKALLEEAKVAVLTYAREQGEAPPNLQAIVDAGYLEAIPEDRAGNPLMYTQLGHGKAELKAVGPDGKEGGWMFKRDHAVEFEVPVKK